MLDMVRAYYAKQQGGTLTPVEDTRRVQMIMLLLADLFSARPTLKTETQRFRVIGELQAMDSTVFGVFMNQHVANLTTKR